MDKLKEDKVRDMGRKPSVQVKNYTEEIRWTWSVDINNMHGKPKF